LVCWRSFVGHRQAAGEIFGTTAWPGQNSVRQVTLATLATFERVDLRMPNASKAPNPPAFLRTGSNSGSIATGFFVFWQHPAAGRLAMERRTAAHKKRTHWVLAKDGFFAVGFLGS
jgi:hypothetical protein